MKKAVRIADVGRIDLANRSSSPDGIGTQWHLFGEFPLLALGMPVIGLKPVSAVPWL